MRIDKVTVADNNVWLVGDDQRVVIVDASHDAPAILAAAGGRKIDGIVCTHGHTGHVNAAIALADASAAPVALHPADRPLWDALHPGRPPDIELGHGDVLQMGGTLLQVWHSPGHSPGSVCLHLAEAGVLFSGDTLRKGGPGPAGEPPGDFATLIESLRRLLLYIPPATVVHPGHGGSTTVADESPHVDEWTRRRR